MRFAPDQPTCVDKNEELVNFLEIDDYMITQAEIMQEANCGNTDLKVKTLAECLSQLDHQGCQLSPPLSSRTESNDVLDGSCFNPHHPHH